MKTKKSTILVVDDQLINRKILEKILADSYTVIFAENGKECMAILSKEAESISAILLDIIMPVMDGYEVLSAIQVNPLYNKIPVIVSSQSDSLESEIHALSLGAQDFISKPYQAQIIRQRLANLIRLRETAALMNAVERDELTGLYNKQFFMRRVREILDEDPTTDYDLMCIDFDRFKLINDTFGMIKGDELLSHTAECIEKLNADLAINSHFGADIFFCLIPRQKKYTAGFFAPWTEAVNDFSIRVPITMRYGIYQIMDRSLSVNAMCDRAQLAIENIKGQYDKVFAIYDDALRKKMLNERFITDSMEEALATGQFHVYYQPKYELTTETIAGAEALVRWIHPAMGLMHPGEFIPLFERNGFITQVDHFVWEQACKDLRERMDAGLQPVAISVNVSRADLYAPDLVDDMLHLVKTYDIPVRYLHLEITESAYTDNPEQIISTVNALRDHGFKIEMDDFGSGYSSLNMLAEIPIDVLKLDMRFIRNESKNISGRGILSFIISLAKWLNLAVVAEGVETIEQISSLRNMDCNYVQGYYYAKPMPKDEFTALLAATSLSEMDTTNTPVHDVAELERFELRPGHAVMIVDDIDINRALLASAFEESHNVVQAENGQMAWDYLDKNFEKVDIVLLDLLMPVMDGFQLLEKIRSDTRMANLPVIITSQGNKDSEVRALAMGADDFLSKPYNLDIVRHRVRNVLANVRIAQIKKDYDLVDRIQRMEASISKSRQVMTEEQMQNEVAWLRHYFDLVRLVNPDTTEVCYTDDETCGTRACYSVWGKELRCSNCISLRALQGKTRYSKLEHTDHGLFFIIAQYAEVDGNDRVIEMVSKMDDTYVDQIFERNKLYKQLDEYYGRLEKEGMQ